MQARLPDCIEEEVRALARADESINRLEQCWPEDVGHGIANTLATLREHREPASIAWQVEVVKSTYRAFGAGNAGEDDLA